MDELELNHEKLGHFHTVYYFMFLFNLETSVTTSFLCCLNLITGIHFVFAYYGVIQILKFIFPSSMLLFSEGSFLLLLKISLYLVAYVSIVLSYYKGKSFRSFTYVTHVVFTLLFYYDMIRIGLCVYKVLWFTRYKLIFLVITPILLNLYFYWVVYSAVTLIGKEKKYMMKGNDSKKPNFLSKEYELLIEKS